jgi:chromosome segregation ATPase
MGKVNTAQAIYSEEVPEMHMDERVGNIEIKVAHLQSDVSELKTDIRELRGDMKATNDAIADVKSDVRDLAARLEGGFAAAARTEAGFVAASAKTESGLAAVLAELTKDIADSSASLRLDLQTVAHASKIGLIMNVVAHLLIAGGVLGVMAKAFGWI